MYRCVALKVKRTDTDYDNEEELQNLLESINIDFTPDGAVLLDGEDVSGEIRTDEISMLDISIAHALFKAIAPGTTVVLVGDADQLPPVGPGRFFSDLINSGKVPVTRLNQVFRQSSGSRIIEAAHLVNSGRVPQRYQDKDCDFFWIRQDDPEKAL